MKTKPNHGRRLGDTSTNSREILVLSKTRYQPLPGTSKRASSGGHTIDEPKHTAVPSDTNIKQSSWGSHPPDRRRLKSQNVRGRQDFRWNKTARQSDEVINSIEENSATDSDTSSSSSYSPSKSPSIRTTKVTSDAKRDLGAREIKAALQSTSEAKPEEMLLRRWALKKREEQEREKAAEKYQETGDMSVFAPFMAPFINGPNRPKLGPWIWDKSVEMWRREHELDGRIVWAPTDEDFI